MSLPHGAVGWYAVCDCGIFGYTHLLSENIKKNSVESKTESKDIGINDCYTKELSQPYGNGEKLRFQLTKKFQFQILKCNN